ncbi:MAG: alpha/beta hydrolase [Proteobacteria bacterium]|nr:alpha/beta hydrolase [Pseudomonadota bacterium]
MNEEFVVKNCKLYGNSPYKIALIHGGPGGAGEMADIARHLSCTMSVMEPFQTALSVQGQVDELKDILSSALSITLLGYSWGAMLSLLIASQNPRMFKKLILVGCPPLGQKFAEETPKTRQMRLSPEDQIEISKIKNKISTTNQKERKKLFLELKKLFEKVDSYNLDTSLSEPHIDFRLDIYEHVWSEAEKLRKEGSFLTCLSSISCPVVFIHGDYDPHPCAAVWEAVSFIKNAHVVILKNCGHTPWVEIEAKNEFYELLKKELE